MITVTSLRRPWVKHVRSTRFSVPRLWSSACSRWRQCFPPYSDQRSQQNWITEVWCLCFSCLMRCWMIWAVTSIGPHLHSVGLKNWPDASHSRLDSIKSKPGRPLQCSTSKKILNILDVKSQLCSGSWSRIVGWELQPLSLSFLHKTIFYIFKSIISELNSGTSINIRTIQWKGATICLCESHRVCDFVFRDGIEFAFKEPSPQGEGGPSSQPRIPWHPQWIFLQTTEAGQEDCVRHSHWESLLSQIPQRPKYLYSWCSIFRRAISCKNHFILGTILIVIWIKVATHWPFCKISHLFYFTKVKTSTQMYLKNNNMWTSKFDLNTVFNFNF